MKKLITAAAALLALVSTPAFADSDGKNRFIRVENRSNTSTLIDVKVTNEHGRTYDAMPSNVISPGYNITLSFDDGEGHNHCFFTATARFSNGVTARRVINACAASVWRIYDIDNTVE